MSKYTYKFFTPLVNFDSEERSFEIFDGVSIREINETELAVFQKAKEEWPNAQGGNYIIECILQKDAPESKPREFFPEVEHIFDQIITILRLFKPERVGYNLILQPYSSEPSAAYSGLHYKHQIMWMLSGSDYVNEKYEISRADSLDLIQFAREIPFGSFSELKLAIEYFNKSYIEPYTPRDAFIDIMITLESLFLKGSRQELGYKLRMRMAFFMTDSPKKREKIFDKMREAYKIRGAIVHGGSTDKLDLDFFLEMRKYARISLIEFLKKPNLRDELDTIILNSGNPT